MTDNKKRKIKLNHLGIALAIAVLGTLVFTTQTVQTVYAYSFTSYANNGSVPYLIAHNSSYIATLTFHGNLNTYALNAPQTLLGTFSCATCESIVEWNGNFYVATGTTITKIGITTTGVPVSLATVAISGPCLFTTQDLDYASGQLLCTIPTANTYKVVALGTMTVTYTSTTLNAGLNPCTGPRQSAADFTENFMVVSCNNNIIATYTIGTVTQLHHIVGGTNKPIIMSTDTTPDEILVTNGSNLDLYSYTTGGGFVTITSGIAVPNPNTIYILGYDPIGKRFLVRWDQTISALNLSNGALLWSVASSLSSGALTSNDVLQLDVVSNSQVLLRASTNFFMSFDTSGLVAGTGGTAGQGTTTGGVDCTNPNNVNLLLCRITATNGGNLGGVGGILDTGIFNVFKNSGLISGNDTNPKTNGVGLFITVIGFGVMTAMFFLATKGQLNNIPTFVWFVASLALLGSLTAIGFIDPTFLIVGIIAIVALAVAKTNNTLFNNSAFSTGGFNGE